MLEEECLESILPLPFHVTMGVTINTKGIAPILAMGLMILFVYGIIQIINTVNEKEICYPLKSSYELCTTLTGSEFFLRGDIKDDLRFIIVLPDGKKPAECLVEKDMLGARIICEDFFRENLNKPDSKIEFLINGVVVSKFTSQDLQKVTAEYLLTDPALLKQVGKTLEKNPEYALFGLFILASQDNAAP